MGNMMVANWYFGCECTLEELGEKLSKAPFDLVVLITAVAESRNRWIPQLARDGCFNGVGSWRPRPDGSCHGLPSQVP